MNKICILTSVHPLLDTRIFYKQTKTLVNSGYNVTLIAQHNKNETIDKIKIIAIPKSRNRIKRFLKLDYLTYRKALKQKADIYHFHDPELLPWMLKLKKKTEAKIIYDVHEDVTKQILSKHWIPKIFRKIISNLFNLFEKWVSKKLDYIITATPNIKSNFKQNNVIDIKNYPILSLFPKEEKKKEANSKKYIELIYVGGLSKERGIKKIIKSLKYINSKYNVKLTLIGKFSEKKFEEEIKSMAEWNSINFLGFLPQKKAYQHMNNANIGLICFLPEPNHINAIPNKIFEYMINKLPIIASDFPLWKEIIEKNDCGFCVDPKKPKKIAETIEHFIKHPEQAKQMRENGQKAILKRYNWEKESKKLLKVYKKLLK
ncbi:glycosyltransferase family 4 protein [Patescibacteria group bacterium]|nr:glycosyltransferase family 4 protein [Patescibacteria group bacterium]